MAQSCLLTLTPPSAANDDFSNFCLQSTLIEHSVASASASIVNHFRI